MGMTPEEIKQFMELEQKNAKLQAIVDMQDFGIRGLQEEIKGYRKHLDAGVPPDPTVAIKESNSTKLKAIYFRR